VLRFAYHFNIAPSKPEKVDFCISLIAWLFLWVFLFCTKMNICTSLVSLMTFTGKKKDSAENVGDAAKEKDGSPATGILKHGSSANTANRYKTSTFATKNILTSGSDETASNKNGSASTNGQPSSGPAVAVPTEPSKKEVMIKGKKHFFSSLPSSNPDLPREKPGLQWMYVYCCFHLL
jgi:cytoskeletal protein RodZ